MAGDYYQPLTVADFTTRIKTLFTLINIKCVPPLGIKRYRFGQVLHVFGYYRYLNPFLSDALVVMAGRACRRRQLDCKGKEESLEERYERHCCSCFNRNSARRRNEWP